MLGHNTLSLDAMADLNSALREVVQTENWAKHEHVQWVIEVVVGLFEGLIPFT